MKGWCPTGKTYVSIPSHKEDGWEDIDLRGDALSHLDNKRRAVGIRLTYLLLLWPKLNTLLPVVFNREWEGKAYNQPKRSSFLSEAESLSAMLCEGPCVPGGWEKGNVTEGKILSVRGGREVPSGVLPMVAFIANIDSLVEALKGRILSVTWLDLSLLHGEKSLLTGYCRERLGADTSP